MEIIKAKTNSYSLKSSLIICAAVSLLAVVIYGQTYDFGYNLDDFLVLDKVEQASPGVDGIFELFGMRYNLTEYRPVTLVSFHLDRIIAGGSSPAVSHITNLLIYLATLWTMVFLLLKIIPVEHCSRYFVVAASVALFCVHPIHANVVSSLKNRDTLLSLFFACLALIFLFKNIRERHSWSSWLLFAIFYLLAIFSKRDALGLLLIAPLAVILYDHSKWKAAIYTGAFLFLLSITYNMAMHGFAPVPEETAIRDAVRFSENPMAQDMASRMAAFFSTCIIYLKMFIYPAGYHFYFGYDVFPFPFSGLMLIISIIICLALLVLFAFAFRKNKPLAFALLLLGINMLYCSNLLAPTAGIVAPRLVYHASFGFCIVLAMGLARIDHAKARNSLTAVLVIVLAFLSFDRSGDWRSFETLLEADLPHLINSHEANRIAGSIYLHRADSTENVHLAQTYYDKALKHFQLANRIYGGNYQPHYYEGVLYFERQDYRKAITALEKSVAVNDEFVPHIHEMLGDSYYAVRDYQNARRVYYDCWRNNREMQYMLNRVSTTYYDENNLEAVRQFNDSLMLADPELYTPYENFGYLYLLDKDTATAAEYFRESLRRGLIDPRIEDLVSRY